MKKRKTWPWIFVLLLLVVMFATCPKEADHQEAFATAFGNNIENINIPLIKNFGEPIKKLVKSATGSNGLINSIAKLLGIDLSIDVTNYGIVSLGRLPNGKIVSVGAFGHVFTMSDDTFRKSIEEWLNEEGFGKLAPYLHKE